MYRLYRHIEKIIERSAVSYPVILLTGSCRSGKTNLMDNLLLSKSVKNVNFEDPVKEADFRNDPALFMENCTLPVLFESAERVKELLPYVKIEVEKGLSFAMFYLTGSMQKDFTETALESLAGKIAAFKLYTFSSREIRGDFFDRPFISSGTYVMNRESYLREKKFSSEENWTFIFKGGYPEIIDGTISRADFYSSLLKTYIERDVNSIIQISDKVKFLNFISAAASRTSHLVNYAELAEEAGISEVTAKKWLSVLEETGLVYLLKPFTVNVEKRVVKTPKLYFMDTGLAAFLAKWPSPEVLESGAAAAAFFETYVVSEIVKSYANAGLEAPLHFYRDKDKTEIDLVISSEKSIYPIEIKKTSSPRKEDAKNFFITSRIKNVKVENPCIICSCEKPVRLEDNVFALPLNYI